jgi:hypothetical protein
MSIVNSLVVATTIGFQSCLNPGLFWTPSPSRTVHNVSNFDPNNLKGSTWKGTWKHDKTQSPFIMIISATGKSGRWQSERLSGTLEVEDKETFILIAKKSNNEVLFRCGFRILIGDSGQVLTNTGTSQDKVGLWLERTEENVGLQRRV